MLRPVAALLLVVPLIGCAGGGSDEGAGDGRTNGAAVEQDTTTSDAGGDSESAAGGDPDRDAGGDPDRDAGGDPDRDAGGDPDRDADADGDPDRDGDGDGDGDPDRDGGSDPSGDGDGDGAGASGADRPAGPAGAAADASELRADLLESRLFATRRQLELELANHGSTPVAVDTIRLATPLFEPMAPDRRDTTVHPGRPALAMPLSYGAARCDTEPDGRVESGVDVVTGGRPVRLDLAQPAVEVLAGLHAHECAERSVQEAVELSFTGDWRETAPGTIAGELELRVSPGAPGASLQQLRGSIIFTVAPTTATPAAGGGDRGAPLATVEGDGGAASLPLVVTAARCDAHALIENKKTFVFTARVSVGDGEITPVPLEPAGTVLDLLERQLASCNG